MNITYTGKQEFLHPKQKEQLDAKIAKLAKLLEIDGKGDKQARVALTHDKNRPACGNYPELSRPHACWRACRPGPVHSDESGFRAARATNDACAGEAPRHQERTARGLG